MIGLLASFAYRWRDSTEAIALIPFQDVFTGRVPNTEGYPFPYMSIIAGGGRQVYRSDKWQGLRRAVSVHIWTDPAELEQGEEIAEMVRKLYANQAWLYDNGRVIDVLDGGPPNCHQINDPTFQAWEIVRALTLCIEQPRVDSPLCPASITGSLSISRAEGSSFNSSLPPESSIQTISSGALLRL